MTVIDKTDTEHWTDQETNIEWYEGDVVISKDPQGRLGGEAIVVSEIRETEVESVHQRGMFWDFGDAKVFAEALDGSSDEA